MSWLKVFLKKNKQKIRFWFWLVLFFFVYVGILRNLFVHQNILSSLVYLLSAVIVLLFLALEFQFVNKKSLWIGIWVVFGLSFLAYLIFAKININTFVAYTLLSLAFVFLIKTKEIRGFNAWKYFNSGAYIFSFLIAIAYSFYLTGTLWEFSLDCEKLYGSVNILQEKIQDLHKEEQTEANSIEYWKKYLEIKEAEQQEIINKQEENNSEKGFLERFVDSGREVLEDVWIHTNRINTINGVKNKLKDSWERIIENVKGVSSDLIVSTTGLREKINDNKRALTLTACNAIGKQANIIFANKYFQWAVVILLSLLFVGVIRLALAIVNIFSYLLFELLYVLGVYKIKMKDLPTKTLF